MKNKIDKKYIVQLKQGNTEVFDIVFHHYREQLFLFSMTLMKSSEDAEEVVQETFINVVKMIHTLKDEASFHSWIFRICYNQAMLLHRKNKKYVSSKDDFNIEEQVGCLDEPSTIFDKKEIVRAIQKEIDKLPESLSYTAQLYYLNSLTIPEIACVLGIPKGTVKNRLFRSRKIIKERLGERGYTPSKLFGFTFTPLIYQAYRSLMAQKATLMSVGSVGMPTSVSTVAATSMSIGVKIALVVSLSGGGLLTKGLLDAQTKNQIEEIAYYNKPTGKDVEVVVKTKQTIDASKVSILNVTDFKVDKNQLRFFVQENGDYTIQIDDISKTITINNIDKEYPKIIAYELNENHAISFTSNDVGSGINYDDSYIVWDQQTFPLHNPIQLDKEYLGEIKVVLVDYAGNTTQDTFMISKE